MQAFRVCSGSRRLAARPLHTARTLWAGKQGTADQAGGPGLPPRGPQSEAEVNQTRSRVYEGDKVEDAPKYQTVKPGQEQPAAGDIASGQESERVRTPASPGRPQDTSEPVGGPM
ncbi:hypothetical protein COHA_009151 [Chlorella ohadii]|uniref:Uncharacterized protein n=1 Tax=Chlorella ohadii TaxID=2649997 RepID=A0AAD5DFX2_9CHLO|nr:hypothetical protein COHA_009151 [Chlorella ohadii]